MFKKMPHLILMILLTVLLLRLSLSFYTLKSKNEMIKQNIILNNIYIDNKSYINKLKEEYNQLEEEILNRYETVDKTQLEQTFNNISNNIDNITRDIANKNEEKNSLDDKKEQLNTQYQTLKKEKRRGRSSPNCRS